jgi:hypothetical protein
MTLKSKSASDAPNSSAPQKPMARTASKGTAREKAMKLLSTNPPVQIKRANLGTGS